MKKKRINKIIDLLKINQPIYYRSTDDFSFSNGKKMSKTWADYIRLDCEHGNINSDKIGEFMEGLAKGGQPKAGTKPQLLLLSSLFLD